MPGKKHGYRKRESAFFRYKKRHQIGNIQYPSTSVTPHMLHSLPTGEPSHETKSIEIDDNADETDKWLEDEEALLSDSLDMLEIDQNTGYGCSISAQVLC